MVVLAGEDRNFDRKDVEDAIELVKQDLAKKEQEAEQRRIEKELKEKEDAAKDKPVDGKAKPEVKPEASNLEEAEKLGKLLTKAWELSKFRKGIGYVSKGVEESVKENFFGLCEHVYKFYTESDGTDKALAELLGKHSIQPKPSTSAIQTPKEASTSANDTPNGPQGPNSSSNQPVQPNAQVKTQVQPQNADQNAQVQTQVGGQNAEVKPPLTELEQFMKKTDRRLGVEDSAYITALISQNAATDGWLA